MKTYNYFWELIKYRPHYYVGDIVGISLHFAAITTLGLILRAYFNGLTGEAGFALSLWPVVWLQVAHALTVTGTNAFAALVYINFEYHSMALLIRNMLARVLQVPAAHPLPTNPKTNQKMTTGEAISTFRDDTRELLQALVIVDDLVGLLVSAAISFTVMISISPLVTAATFLPLGFVIAIAQRLGERAKQYRAQSREATSQVTSLIASMFENTQAIKVASAEARLIGHFTAVNQKRQETMVKDRVFSKLIEALSNGTVDIGLGLVLLSIAQFLASGELTLGDFALFAAYIWPTTFLMRVAGMMITRYKQSGVSTTRMELMMHGTPPEAVVEHHPIYLRRPVPELPIVAKKEADQLDLLQVEGLSYWFEPEENGEERAGRRGEERAVEKRGGDGRQGEERGGEKVGVFDVSFAVERGQVVVITGRIGSGKSTLVKTLLGLHPPMAGRVWWNGKLVEQPDQFFVPPRVAYAGQIARLFSLSVRDNILLGLPEKQVDMARAVKTAVFTQDLAQMDAGLDTMVGPRGVRLSGGQVQRAAAARMFVRDAELMIMDDLSSALDVETEKRLWENVRELSIVDGQLSIVNEPTFLVVSHRKSVLRMADQILVMKNGRVIDSGKLDELLQRCEEMQLLWQE